MPSIQKRFAFLTMNFRSRQALFYLLMFSVLVIPNGCSNKKQKNNIRPPHVALFSPNGEMLSGGPLGQPSCEQAYGSWFDRLDTTKVNRISHDAFIADAHIQFERMDINHDGYITANELSTYRATYNFDPSIGFGYSRKMTDHEEQFSDIPKNNLIDPKAPDWAKNIWTADASDPVMSADRSLKFKVNQDDFIHQAEETFSWLDQDVMGGFTKERLVSLCPKSKRPE
jgi:hypothetical protein